MSDSIPSSKPDDLQQPSNEGLAAVPLFGLGDEMSFRRQFAVQFLASYAAANFNALCANGHQDTLERLPVEDAEYLSGTAWRHWCETMPMMPSLLNTPYGAESAARR
jgi:hypothetical protein